MIDFFGLVNGNLNIKLVKNIFDSKGKGVKLMMFFYLLFFSFVLFEIEKDFRKIIDFCYELFNKIK